ncbi:Beta,beta-carotene 15,15'-dioxygenase [Bagarius yarrelli]|uniref:Beta,beta-carotene 15,15'-dioxygenase n=1 Tax=Bagarius yarrelli TaxID=175774 RepID=A0A556U0V3_BAGYA|nr:Beta,beta-carotene 15,15'-dioxygenase [Bagarius yarrelli]
MQVEYGKNKEEHPHPVKAEVRGSLPEWLHGTLVRNGPGLFSFGETSYNHWFDGMALLHSFTIKHGEVTYRSKYLRSDTYNSNLEADRIVVSEMGTMAYPHPSKNMLNKMITFVNHTVPDFTDNCACNIIKYGNDYFATSETNYIRKIDPVTLETQDKVDYKKYVSVNLAISHPHYDKEGNSYNMGTSIANKGKTKYIIFKVPAADLGKTQAGSDWTSPLKDTEIMATIPCRSMFTPSYYHSFGMTENYFIFFELPLKLDIVKMATAYMRGVLIHLIDRRTKKEVDVKYYTDTMVVYHHVNAFEEDGHVIVDVIAFDDHSLYELFYLDKQKELSASSTVVKPTYKRFVLPLMDKPAETGENLVKLKYSTATAVKEKDGKLHCQPEVINEGKHAHLSVQAFKLDVETKLHDEWSAENCFPSESVFVPRPGATEEDDGVVLNSVINCNPGESDFLLVLDGKSFQELARASVNVELHMDMHGFFIPLHDAEQPPEGTAEAQTPRFFSTSTEGEIRITKILKEKFPQASSLKVVDISGGCGAMYEIHIESDDFRGKRIVQQHQLVNQVRPRDRAEETEICVDAYCTDDYRKPPNSPIQAELKSELLLEEHREDR